MGIVAFPAHITFSMSIDINFWYISWCICSLVMTLPALLFAGWLFSRNEFRVHEMVIRYHMTCPAFKGSVVRHDFNVGDVTMARAALFRRMRKQRIVWVVA